MVCSDSPTKAFRSLVVLVMSFFSPPRIEQMHKVLYHLPDSISMKTGLSAGRHYLH